MQENYELAEQVADEWPRDGEQRDLSLLAHQVIRLRDRLAAEIELARLAERERCAKIVRELWSDPKGVFTANYVENAIRNPNT